MKLATYLPEQVLTNDDLAASFPVWLLAKTEKTKGIGILRLISGSKLNIILITHNF
jgi:hypothetical protein